VTFFGTQIEVKRKQPQKHIVPILPNSDPPSNLMLPRYESWKQHLPIVTTLLGMTIDAT
jgi:hypothetical protein